MDRSPPRLAVAGISTGFDIRVASGGPRASEDFGGAGPKTPGIEWIWGAHWAECKKKVLFAPDPTRAIKYGGSGSAY